MMAPIAYFSLFLALACAIYTGVAALRGLQKQPARWLQSSSNGLRAIAGLLTFAVLILWYVLLQRDFQFEYVASYTDLRLPTMYVISALWAGQQGSLLFWAWALALCYVVFLKQYQPKAFAEAAYLHLAAALTLGFFLIVLLFAANPFQQLSFVPPDGNGLNPLLQNFYMAIHPPILFIGYAAFAIPFALTFAALARGQFDAAWTRHVRNWTLFAWYFLGIGILLGAHWAYLELGWGGYWAWDPVENSSFIPWLTATALLHTLRLQRRRDMFTRWNLFLGMLNFALCILATFITRSGVIDSVHAFGKSPVGWYFLTFLILSLLCFAGLVMYRWNALRSPHVLTALFSKEGSLVFSNQLFLGFGFAILYGTLYPFFAEMLGGRKVAIDQSFFNTVSVPVGILLLGLLGLCQLLGWEQAPFRQTLKKFTLPASLAVIGMILMVIWGVRHVGVFVTGAFASLIFSTLCVDLGQTVRACWQSRPQAIGPAFLAALIAQKQRYAAAIVHVGMAVLCMGIAVSSVYRQEREVELQPGASVTLGAVRFQYERLYMNTDAQKKVVAAEISVYEHERKIATLTPAKQFYEQAQESRTATEIGLDTSLTRDLYAILSGWQEDQTASLTFIINPLILWIWIGGFFVLTLGMVVALLPRSWARGAVPQTAASEEE